MTQPKTRTLSSKPSGAEVLQPTYFSQQGQEEGDEARKEAYKVLDLESCPGFLARFPCRFEARDTAFVVD